MKAPDSIRAAWLLLAALAGAGSTAAVRSEPATQAEPPELGSSEQGLIDFAAAHSPRLAGLRYEQDAALARSEAAGRLEDPQLTIEMRDVGQGESTRYLVTQTVPLFGKRALRERIARSEADRAAALLGDSGRELRLRIGAAYARYWYAARAIGQLDELARTLDSLETLARQRYAAGLVPQQDAIKAAVERSELERRRLVIEAGRAQMVAEINAALARDPDAPLAPARVAPPVRDLPPLDELLRRLRKDHPALAAEQASADGAALAASLAGRERYPDLVLGAAPIQRGGSLDAWDFMIGVRLPLQRDRLRAEIRSADSARRAALARRDALEADLLGAFGQRWSELALAQRQSTLLRGKLIPLSEANFRSALGSYQTGGADFTTLLDALRQRTAGQFELIDAELETRLRALEIERLAGDAS